MLSRELLRENVDNLQNKTKQRSEKIGLKDIATSDVTLKIE